MNDSEDEARPPQRDQPTVTSGGMRDSAGSDATALSQSARRMPERIGDYRIIGFLGEGGMGVVWEAEQQHPQRRVAIKVMRAGHMVDELRARMFHREAEILGRLKHPNIAAIYESGHTDDGHDFFAMELVRGATLDEWLGARPSPVTRDEMELRLRLFRTLCDAVNYAHQRGVIHRDLKPANIVVTEETASGSGSSTEAQPRLKILDFGLARITDADVPSTSTLTEIGLIKGTLQYMSPEQARGEADAIDVRTDVYTLGMILYELLSGRRPYDVGKSGLAETLRIICEERPRPLRDSWTGTRKLDPDVATIVEKALEKEPDRRYPSAAALSEDIERFLASQPIVARPASHMYRLRKYVRRHRVGVSVAALLALMLVGFAVTMTVEAARIARERDRANREVEASQRVSDFMTSMFRVVDPSEARGNSVTAREILDKASKGIDTGLAKDPELQARLMDTMGSVYDGLGIYGKARTLFETALEKRRRILGAEHPATLSTMSSLATVYLRQGRFADAEKISRAVLEARRRTLGPEHPDTIRAIRRLGVAENSLGHYAEAEKFELEAVALGRRVLGADHPETLTTMSNLGLTYMDLGRLPEAEKLFREVLETRQRVLGRDHPDTLGALNNLAYSLAQQGKKAEAEARYLEEIDLNRRVLGPEHPDTLSTMYNLAFLYLDQKRFPEAEALERQVLEVRQRVLGRDHFATLATMDDLGKIYDQEHRYGEAEKLQSDALAGWRRLVGPDNPDTLSSLEGLAITLMHEGRLAEAGGMFRQTLETRQRVLGPTHPLVGYALYNMACLAVRSGDPKTALLTLRDAFDHNLPTEVAVDMGEDDEFTSLHGDATFKALVAEAQQRAMKK